jgi:hypothetical protein
MRSRNGTATPLSAGKSAVRRAPAWPHTRCDQPLLPCPQWDSNRHWADFKSGVLGVCGCWSVSLTLGKRLSSRVFASSSVGRVWPVLARECTARLQRRLGTVAADFHLSAAPGSYGRTTARSRRRDSHHGPSIAACRSTASHRVVSLTSCPTRALYRCRRAGARP